MINFDYIIFLRPFLWAKSCPNQPSLVLAALGKKTTKNEKIKASQKILRPVQNVQKGQRATVTFALEPHESLSSQLTPTAKAASAKASITITSGGNMY